MTYSQKYALVQFIPPLADNTQFAASEWPLHVTLADVFAVDLQPALIAELQVFLSNHPIITTTANHDTQFGDSDRPVTVTLLHDTPQLRALHDGLMDILEAHGAVFNVPAYTRNGFIPHATVQSTARLHSGDTVRFDAVSIVDFFPDGDWQQREVLQTFMMRTA